MFHRVGPPTPGIWHLASMCVYHIQNSVQICVPILTHEHEILETVE